MIFEIGKSFLKYLGLFLLFYALYLVYIVFIKPYLYWRKYRCYSNVMTSEAFRPLVGDFQDEMDCDKEGKVFYAYREERAAEYKKYDIQLSIDCNIPTFLILSNKAVEEFVELQKTAIDRLKIQYGISEMVTHSFVPQRSTNKVIQRRKNVTTWLGLNGASRYIPHMVDCCNQVLSGMKESDGVDIMHSMNELTFNVFVDILFGNDVEKLVSDVFPYTNPDGSIENITLREMLIRVGKCYIDQYMNLTTYLFPMISQYKLANPYKRDHQNLTFFKQCIKKVFLASNDQTSVGYKIMNNPDCTPEEKLDDLVGIMLAGTETTSHSLVSCFYFLSKYPEKLEKLRQELQEEGFIKGEDFVKQCTVEKLQNCTYLNCVIKETLRCDTAVSDTFDYFNSADVEICGVPIPKGSRLRVDLIANHFDDDKWLDPHTFIPERFDFESDFYKKSKDAGKTAEVYSRRTFSIGNRSCPGQSFALLEMKIVLAYFATHMDFTFSQEDLNKKGIGFGMGSQIVPNISITKK